MAVAKDLTEHADRRNLSSRTRSGNAGAVSPSRLEAGAPSAKYYRIVGIEPPLLLAFGLSRSLAEQ